MTSTASPMPSREDLLALFDAAQENAFALITDAETLAESDRFPRAYALATLALEELGKAQLCILALTRSEMSSGEFWHDFGDHKRKLAHAHSFISLRQPQPLGTLVEKWAKRDAFSSSAHTEKLSGLYVDYADNKVIRPVAEITEKLARDHIKVVGDSLIFASLSLPKRESLDEWLTNIRARQQAIEMPDVEVLEGLAEALRQAILGGSKEELINLVRQVGLVDVADSLAIEVKPQGMTGP